MNFVGFEKVSIENNFVRKKVKGIYLDFNAIAKGYCVDVISNMLKEKNINNHLVEIGGEMVASGKNQITNRFWRVGITDPLNVSSNNFISKIELKNKSLASSGNYRKYIVDKKSEKKIVHTINPKNGNAYETNILGTSVIANHCMTADAYATSFMAMPIKKSKELISSLKNIDVMIIYYDENSQMKIYKTEGFDKLILD
jgi:thiamine biosynthesis lipoprotein